MPEPHTRPWVAMLMVFWAVLTALAVYPSATALSAAHSKASDLPPAPEPTREPGMMFDPTDRLAPPPMSDPPTQVEQGHYVYYLSCMVCHGDQGQGLTDEWRGVLDPADQNCWQSKCHAPNHPPEGFELPRAAPAIIGPGRLAHHQTAAGLYQYLRSRMPWQAPGLLSDEEYWQLSAFLLDANGFRLDTTRLGPDNAAQVRLAPKSTETQSAVDNHQRSAIWPLLGSVAALLLLGSLMLHRRHRTH